MKRQRGRSRRSGGGNHNPNKHFESNGPDVKIRGSAQQILDKYLQYARDAQTSGDRVNAENYFQHAEHYSRLIAATQPKDKPRDPQQDQKPNDGDEASASGDGEQSAETGSDANKNQNNGSDRDGADRNDRGRRRQRPNNRRDQNESEGRTDAGEAGTEVEAKTVDAPSRMDAEVEVQSATSPETPQTIAEEAPAPKPRRRAPRKPKVVAAEGDEPTDGIMKTLSRGRKPKAAVLTDTSSPPEVAD